MWAPSAHMGTPYLYNMYSRLTVYTKSAVLLAALREIAMQFVGKEDVLNLNHFF